MKIEWLLKNCVVVMYVGIIISIVGNIICGLYDSFIIVDKVVKGVCSIVVSMFVMFKRVKLLVNLGMLIK